MSLILSIESSADVCSVALHSNGILHSIKESEEPYIHGKILAKYIEELLIKSDIHVSNLSAIAVSGGPGSYTGLRIGVSISKGICYASGIPLISVNTLHCLAFSIKEKCSLLTENSIIMPMIDARRMEVYTTTFNKNLLSISNIKPEIVDSKFFKSLDNSKTYFAGGNGTLKLDKTVFPKNFNTIDNISFSADIIGRIAYLKFIKKEFENIAQFEPLYLKEFAEIIKK